jgi:hypothetical protein
VGLDVPCQKCGRPIYYNYKGPVDGLCGRCSDGSRNLPTGRFGKSRRIGLFLRPGRKSNLAFFAVLAFGAIAAAIYLFFTK